MFNAAVVSQPSIACRYLERSIASTLVKLYASDPTNADEWLADEIYRAACDPGAIGVFQYVPSPHLIT